MHLRNFIFYCIGLLLLASPVLAVTTVPWVTVNNATTTPSKVNGAEQEIRANYFVGSSTSLISSFLGRVGIATTSVPQPARLNVGGDVGFNLVPSLFTTLSVGDPTGAVATVIPFPIGHTYTASGFTHTYRIYAYRTLNGATVYSTGYSEVSYTDDNLGGTYDVGVTWNSVANATGYKILIQDDTGSGCDFSSGAGCYLDDGSASLTDGDTFSSGRTVTPNTATVMIQATSTDFYTNSTTHRIGVGTTSPGSRLVVAAQVLGDGIIADGTGTLSPQVGLSYNSTINASFGLALANQHFSTISNQFDTVFRSTGLTGNSLIIDNEQAGPLIFATNPSGFDVERMRILSGGNVGIGTNNPGAPLDVNGNIYDRSGFYGDNFFSYTGNGINWTLPASKLSRFSFGDSLSSTHFEIQNSGSAALLEVLASGNIGVSSSTPWGELSVNPNALGSGVPEFTIGSSTATHFLVTGAGLTGVGSTTPWATLAVNPIAGPAANQFVIGSSTATNFIVNNTGFIGLGTTSPTAGLAIKSQGTTARVVAISNSVGTETLFINNSGQIMSGTPSSGTNPISGKGLQLFATSPGISALSTGGSGASSQFFFAKRNGTDASPTAPSVGHQVFKIIGVPYDGGTYQQSAYLAMQVDQPAILNTSVGEAIVFNTGITTTNTESMRISSWGDVGIGTTSPLAKLTIVSANSDATFATTGLAIFNGIDSGAAADNNADIATFGLCDLVGTTNCVQTTMYSRIFVDKHGHLEVGSSTDPVSGTDTTVGSGATDCGTNPVIFGTDIAGVITVGSGVNGGKCTVTFADAYKNAPVCPVQDTTTANLVRQTARTTTGFAISGTLIAGDVLTYGPCIGLRGNIK